MNPTSGGSIDQCLLPILRIMSIMEEMIKNIFFKKN